MMKLFGKVHDTIVRDRWEIGFVKGGLDAIMSKPSIEIQWLKHNFKDRWFADPFILDVTESDIFVLAEEYQYSTNKGRIAELVVDRDSCVLKELNIILELDTHLSFPAIWREKGQIFVYPESWGSGALSLYEYRGRGQSLKQVKVLCDDSMADAIMTERFGKKRLLSTKENDRLRIYDYDVNDGKFVFSEEMDFGTATARNGGDFFEWEGWTYRPAQVCVNRYGEAVEIQKVWLDETGKFSFEPIKRFCSPHPKLNTGMHTLNTYKGVSVIDVHGWVNPRIVDLIIIMKKMFK